MKLPVTSFKNFFLSRSRRKKTKKDRLRNTAYGLWYGTVHLWFLPLRLLCETLPCPINQWKKARLVPLPRARAWGGAWGSACAWTGACRRTASEGLLPEIVAFGAIFFLFSSTTFAPRGGKLWLPGFTTFPFSFALGRHFTVAFTLSYYFLIQFPFCPFWLK